MLTLYIPKEKIPEHAPQVSLPSHDAATKTTWVSAICTTEKKSSFRVETAIALLIFISNYCVINIKLEIANFEKSEVYEWNLVWK